MFHNKQDKEANGEKRMKRKASASRLVFERLARGQANQGYLPFKEQPIMPKARHMVIATPVQFAVQPEDPNKSSPKANH